jgi:hypothetical protein
VSYAPISDEPSAYGLCPDGYQRDAGRQCLSTVQQRLLGLPLLHPAIAGNKPVLQSLKESVLGPRAADPVIPPVQSERQESNLCHRLGKPTFCH